MELFSLEDLEELETDKVYRLKKEPVSSQLLEQVEKINKTKEEEPEVIEEPDNNIDNDGEQTEEDTLEKTQVVTEESYFSQYEIKHYQEEGIKEIGSFIGNKSLELSKKAGSKLGQFIVEKGPIFTKKGLEITKNIMITLADSTVQYSKLAKENYDTRQSFLTSKKEELNKLKNVLETLDEKDGIEYGDLTFKGIDKLLIKNNVNLINNLNTMDKVSKEFENFLAVTVENKLNTANSFMVDGIANKIRNPLALMVTSEPPKGFVEGVPDVVKPNDFEKGFSYNKILPGNYLMVVILPGSKLGNREDVHKAYSNNELSIIKQDGTSSTKPLPAFNKTDLVTFVDSLIKFIETQETVSSTIRNKLMKRDKLTLSIQSFLQKFEKNSAKHQQVNEFLEFSKLLMKLHDNITIKGTKQYFKYLFGFIDTNINLIETNTKLIIDKNKKL